MDLKIRVAVTVAVFLCAAGANAQQWSGGVTVAVAGQSVSGNEESFFSQRDIHRGFTSEELSLQRKNDDAFAPLITFRASGFGQAAETDRARLDVRFHAPLTLSLTYDRRDSFFALDDPQRDESKIERWGARATYDGLASGKLTLDLRRLSHTGSAITPLFALNERYPLLTDLNQRSDEVSIRFDSRGPVPFSFEQSFARQQRRDRISPDAANAIGVSDPDLLIASSTTRDDVQNMPTSRLSTSFGGSQFEGAVAMRYTPAKLNATVPVTTTFGIDRGNAGNVSFVDSVTGSASRDAFAGNARFAWRLAPRWLVRASTDYRDTSTDTTLLGQRLIQMINPNGATVELTAPLSNHSILSFTDANERLELERAAGRLTLRAGALASQRYFGGVHRRSTGETLSASWRGSRFFTTADAEHGSFERYVFRTDPQKVNKFHFRAGTVPRSGWSIQGEGRFERGENPTDVANLAHRLNSGSLDVTFAPRDRDALFGVNVGTTNLHTRTDLVLPGNTAGTSIYDLSLLTATAHGEYAIQRVRISGSLTRARDNGSTWPVRTWNGDARVMVRGPARSEFGVFGERWSYNEQLASSADFGVTRYGVLLGWRLP